MALLQDRRAQAQDESLFLLVRNADTVALSVGYQVAYHNANVTSATGFDVDQGQ